MLNQLRKHATGSSWGLCGEALQDLLAESLRLAEKLLVLDEDPVQLQRFVGV
jgi:hypothetical protein